VRFGGEFQPVSIRMAKEQDLPLNPLKISGLCGRLMCCLRYEYEAYKEFKQRAPKCGTQVDLSDGTYGKISSMNVPRETLTVRQQGGPELTVPLSALDCSAGRGCPCRLDVAVVEQQAATVAVARGTTPALREAERIAEDNPSQRPKPSRRKRRSSKGGGQQGGPKPDAQSSNGQQKQGGQKKSGTSSGRSGQGVQKRNDGSQKQQGAASSTEGSATIAGRRRDVAGASGGRGHSGRMSMMPT